jgi:hypothetical protein
MSLSARRAWAQSRPDQPQWSQKLRAGGYLGQRAASGMTPIDVRTVHGGAEWVSQRLAREGAKSGSRAGGVVVDDSLRKLFRFSYPDELVAWLERGRVTPTAPALDTPALHCHRAVRAENSEARPLACLLDEQRPLLYVRTWPHSTARLKMVCNTASVFRVAAGPTPAASRSARRRATTPVAAASCGEIMTGATGVGGYSPPPPNMSARQV